MTLLKISSHRKQVFLFSAGILVYFTLNMQRVAIPGTIFNELQNAFQASASALANLSTGFMCAYAIAHIPAGILVDRYGGMKVLFCGAGILAIGALLFPFSQSYIPLYLSRILIGFGGGFIYLSLVKESYRLFPKQFSAIMGFILLIGFLGGFAGTTPLVKLTHRMGWRHAMFIFSLLSVLAVLTIALLWHNRERIPKTPNFLGLRNYKKALFNCNNLKFFLSSNINYSLYCAILTIFGKKFLEDIIHLDSTVASICCALMVLLPALSNQIAGMLSLKFGNKRRFITRLCCFCPFFACCLFLVASLSILPVNISRYLFMLSFLFFSMAGGFSSVINCIVTEVNPPEETGIAIGTVNFVCYMTVAFWGTITGFIMDLFDSQITVLANGVIVYPKTAYITIFIIFFIVSSFTFWISFKIPETNGKNIYSGKEKTYHFFRFIKITMHS